MLKYCDCVLPVALTEGKLSNSEILQNLPIYLSHLSVSQRSDLVDLIQSSKMLFSDGPSQIYLLKHDIDVGD